MKENIPSITDKIYSKQAQVELWYDGEVFCQDNFQGAYFNR